MGVAEVLTDSETGLSTTRVLDNYPDAGEGGIRVTDILHQFAKPGEFMRLAVSRFNKQKLHEYAQAYVQKHGYQSAVWMAHQMDGDKIVKENAVPWRPRMMPEEMRDVHFNGLSAEKHVAEMNRRFVRGMHNLRREGIGFAYGFSNVLGRGYCTFTLVLSFLRENLVDVQAVQDRWNLIVQAMAKFQLGGAKDIRVQDRIMAPAGMTWQKDLVDVDQVQIVSYADMTEQQREDAVFMEHDSALDPELHRNLRRLRTFVQLAQTGDVNGEGDNMDRIQNAIERNRTKSGKIGAGRLAHDQNLAGYIGRVSRAVYGAPRVGTRFLKRCERALLN